MHTKEPWMQAHRECKDGMFRTEIFDLNREAIAELTWHKVKTPNGFTTDRDANARRIVACVNACEGLDTEKLENSQKPLWLFVQELTEQRDELLAALKHLYHNAYKSGADMGLALDFAKEEIAKADLTQ